MALLRGNKCYKRFVKHVIDAAKYICSDASANKGDIDIFKTISDTGNFKISYTYGSFDGCNDITFIAEGKVIQDRTNRVPMYAVCDAPDDGTYEFVLLRLVDRKGSYEVKFSLAEWQLICEYINIEIDLIKRDYIKADEE